MAYISVTYTFVNGAGNLIDATEVNQNFDDVVQGLQDGTKDLNVNEITAAGDVALNKDTDIGNAVGDTLTVTARIDSDVDPADSTTYNLGSSALSWNAIYGKSLTLDSSATVGADLNVTQDLNLTRDATISGTLNVTGESTLTGDANFSADATVTGNLGVTQDVDVSRDATVAGTTTLTGDVAMSNDLVVSGDATVTGTTDLNGDVALGSGASDTISANGVFGTAILPSAGENIGGASNRWGTLYATTGNFSGNVTAVGDSSTTGGLYGNYIEAGTNVGSDVYYFTSNDSRGISSGTVSPAKRGWIRVSAQTGSTDDLDNISTTSNDDFSVIYLTAFSGHTITIKNGTGNIKCGSDRTLTDDDVAGFVRQGSSWLMFCYQSN